MIASFQGEKGEGFDLPVWFMYGPSTKTGASVYAIRIQRSELRRLGRKPR